MINIRLTVLRQLCNDVATCDTVDAILDHLDRNLRSLLPLEAVYLLLSSSSGAQSRFYLAKQSFGVAEAAEKLGFSPLLLRYLNHVNTKLETVNPVVVPNGVSMAILVPLITPKRILGTIVVKCPASTVLTAELSLVLQEISLLIAPGVERARQIADEVRRQLENSQQADAQYLSTIYDSAYEYIGMISPNGIVLDCNRASLTFHERTRDEMVGAPYWETPWFSYTPGACERLWNALQRASKGKLQHWIFPLYRASGELIVFDYSLSPVKNSEGDVLHIVAEGRPMALYGGERGLSRCKLPAPFSLPPPLSSARHVLPHAAPEAADHLPGLAGESTAMKRVAAAVHAVVSSAVPVLLLGEAGTGKDLVARAIHNLSCSSSERFVKQCARSDFSVLLTAEGAIGGLPALLKEIGRGTLYLDKVDELPGELQAKLFRFLSENMEKRQRNVRAVRCRWIFSAKPDLPHKALSGQFRNDLYNLLNDCPIAVPPLRERREDIPALVHFFADKYARRCRKEITFIPDETLAAFAEAVWPVNVLQLEVAVADAVSRAQEGRLPLPRLTGVLSPFQQSSKENAAPACERLEAVEQQYILSILRQSQGRVSLAATRLGLKRTTLNSRLRRLGITATTLRSLRQSARAH